MRRLTMLLVGVLLVASACRAAAPTPAPDAPPADGNNPVIGTPSADLLNPFGTEPPPTLQEVGIPLTVQALGGPTTMPTPEATSDLFGGITVPENQPRPGEIATLTMTEDPQVAAFFDKVTLIRVYTTDGSMLQMELLQDGTLTVNGAVATNVGAGKVLEIDTILDEINFFGISGAFAATFPAQDSFIYTIAAERMGTRLSIRVDDALMPPELGRLIEAMLNLLAS